MPYTFQPRDEGLLAIAPDGRVVAHIETRIITESNDPNLRVQKITVTEIPKEKWKIHFTAMRLTVSELQVFLTELATQSVSTPSKK